MTSEAGEGQVVWHQATVTREHREIRNGHRSFILLFTGLSASGKSTLAHAIEAELHQIGCRTFVFDGDNVRHGLCADLGFCAEDRHENIRRIGEMAKLFIEAGVIALTAFIAQPEFNTPPLGAFSEVSNYGFAKLFSKAF